MHCIGIPKIHANSDDIPGALTMAHTGPHTRGSLVQSKLPPRNASSKVATQHKEAQKIQAQHKPKHSNSEGGAVVAASNLRTIKGHRPWVGGSS